MILECPNCGTSYEIPVSLPEEGRKVRCASCQHVWTATNPPPEISLSDFEDEEIVFMEGDELPQEASAEETGPAAEAEIEAEAEAEPEPEIEAEAEAEAEAETGEPDSPADEGQVDFDSISMDEAEAAPAEAEAEAEPVAEAAPADTGETEDAGEELSDSDIDDAFSAALDEAEGAEAITGEEPPNEAAAPEGEPAESPPIVIGKAKKRRGPMLNNVAAGWAGLGLVLTGLMSIAYFQRTSLVSALPGAASTYERLGLPVNVRGLEFADVKYSWESSAGRPVLEVFGNIVNVTNGPLKVPTVVFGLRTKEKVEVYQWAADVSSELLEPGKKTGFSAQIPTPPKSIRDVQVRFAKVR